MTVAKAAIKWLVPSKFIPPVLKTQRIDLAYHPILVFKNQYDEPIWKNNVSTVPLWSSVVYNVEIIGNESISTVRYLVEEAPQNLIVQNAEFYLYEGKTVVAEGKIIDIIGEDSDV